jgi:hypothetical protein
MPKVRVTHTATSDTNYYGEHKCQSIYKSGNACRNMAYFSHQGKLLCGQHTLSIKTLRKKLPNNPQRKALQEKKLHDRQQMVETTAQKNRECGQKGSIICSKMKMMKPIDHVDGYLKVFPNFKHQNRCDGFGCSSLSPKSMGPIDHGQVDLPVSKNMENFHQGNKVFESEVGADGEPKKEFFDTQIEMYNDPVPHRHKKTSGNKNAPVYSVWVDKSGQKNHITYLESRQFYCNFYERIAQDLNDYKKLCNDVYNGVNIQLVGYDAYDVDPGTVPNQIILYMDQCYNDISRPFGHELVLYTMLFFHKMNIGAQYYPWRVHKTFDF